eukprot:4490716-Prymnesium_polylepis.1
MLRVSCALAGGAAAAGRPQPAPAPLPREAAVAVWLLVAADTRRVQVPERPQGGRHLADAGGR